MLTLEQQQAIYYRDGRAEGRADLVKTCFENLFKDTKNKNKTISIISQTLGIPVNEILEILNNQN